jgi:hypothetical protein
MTVRRRVAGLVVTLVLAGSAFSVAQADQRYRVDGRDTYQIGGHDVRSEIAYSGVGTLRIEQKGRNRKYTAHVEYDRNDQGTLARSKASFESTISAAGEQVDGTNHDPDYLTVLNQPFAVQLDAPTLRDLSRLHGTVPFDFPSPMTGAPLHGTLRHIDDAVINGVRVLGVAFDASGPLHGSLPDHPAISLAGTIRMNGTAYYTYGNALLLALDATLAIGGNLNDTGTHAPVSIVYKRTIRAASPAPLREAQAATKAAR